MKKKVFLDTGGLAALIVDNDPDHESAECCFKSFGPQGYQLFTSDAVLDELVTLLRIRYKLHPEKIFQVLHNLFVSDLSVIELGRDQFGKALILMHKFSEHSFSMTDCMSFVMMKELKIKEAFSTDKHFSIAGFSNLLLK